MVEADTLEKVVQELDNALRICREQLTMTPLALDALGLPSSPEGVIENRLRVKILEGLVPRLRALPVIQIGPTTCQDFISINNEQGLVARIVCQLPPGHEGSHKCSMVGRKDNQRTDTDISWTMAPFLQKVP